MLTSTYDNLDRLLTRELGGTGVTPMKAAWDYDAIGDLDTVTRSGKSGGSWVTAGVTTYAHDDLGRTTNIRLADVGDKTISEYGYTFDAADRITGMSVNGTARTFGYDETNQITNDNGAARTYDANGNRTGGSYATDDANRMTTDGTWTYTYDDAGQATGKSKSGVAWTYEYDLRGQLVEASDGTTTVTYQYDAFGNRIGRSEDDGIAVTEERYVVDGWDTAKPGAVGTENFDVVMDLDDENDIVARRLFGPGFDELVGGQDGGGTVRWYGTDHLGSVRKVFDNSGTVTNTVDYDAFGGFLGGVPVDRYAYTGREWDATTGLTHYRAREKDGHRFLTEDPKGFPAGDANLARYVGNGAINARDPSGFEQVTRPGYQGPKDGFDLDLFWDNVEAIDPEVFEYWATEIFPNNGAIHRTNFSLAWRIFSKGVTADRINGTDIIYLHTRYTPYDAAIAFIKEIREGYFSASFKARKIGNDCFPIAASEYNKWFLQQASRSALVGAEIIGLFYSIQLSGADWIITVEDLAEGKVDIINYVSILTKLPIKASASKVKLVTKSGKTLGEMNNKEIQFAKRMGVLSAMAETIHGGGKPLSEAFMKKWKATVETRMKARGQPIEIILNATKEQRKGNRHLHTIKNGKEYLYLGPGVSRFELYHECLHAFHYRNAPELFRRGITTKGGLQDMLKREEYVYEFMRQPGIWNKLTKEERDTATKLIEYYRKTVKEGLEKNPHLRE